MALITSFSTLKDAVAEMANRATAEISNGLLEGFVQEVEDRLNNVLRTWQMEESASITTNSSGVGTIPTDFLEARFVYDSDSVEVPFVTADWLVTRPSDAPKCYTLLDGSLKLAPAAAETLTLLYYEKIPALTSSNTSNWLLTAKPTIYLYSVLEVYANWRDEDEAAAKWNAKATQALIEFNASQEANRASGPLRMPRDFLYGNYSAYT